MVKALKGEKEGPEATASLSFPVLSLKNLKHETN